MERRRLDEARKALAAEMQALAAERDDLLGRLAATESLLELARADLAEAVPQAALMAAQAEAELIRQASHPASGPQSAPPIPYLLQRVHPRDGG